MFSNTNRTNWTNLVGCDMVCIRGIREIRGQLNIIHTRICFSNTNWTNNTNLASAWHLLSLGQYMYAKNSMSHDNLNLSSRKR